ncbi:hypothetical protein JJQ58_07860, partial [Mammaliicoccus fleurettii]|nr:hypothetical protein [Mammaliicoccus fleurettii]MBS3697380.1 hypothetical protein [Mammaliicoccus fleurettii]
MARNIRKIFLEFYIPFNFLHKKKRPNRSRVRLIASIYKYLPGNVLLSRNVSPTTIGAKELNF